MARENRFDGLLRAAASRAVRMVQPGTALVLMVGGAILPSGRVHALTIRVPGDRLTIQAGLDAASSGDTVLVAEGTYSGAGNRDLDFTGKDLVLLSETGPETTIIDAAATFDDPHVGCQFTRGESPATRVEGITIMRAYGGGATCRDGSSPTFVRCFFTRCDGVSAGGVDVDNASPAFTDCRFSRNTPATGGGIRLNASQSTFVRCTFVDNGTDSNGAASVGNGSNVVFTDCVFESNLAADLGDVWAGALFVGGSFATLENCLFIGNDAHSAKDGSSRGGAILAVASNLTIRGCTFQDNRADVGGAIRAESSFVDIQHSIFRQNNADQGAAIACELGTTEIRSCTLFDNTGSGVFASPGSSVIITEVIIAFGSEGRGIDCLIMGDVKIACSDIFSNAGGDWIGCISGELGKNGNIAADPLFCNTDTGDLSIANNSPCAPSQSACGLIGALGPGCQSAVMPMTWGAIKASFAGDGRRKSR